MKRQRIKRLLCVLLVLAVALLAANGVGNRMKRDRMLRSVGLDRITDIKQIDYACWNDALKYTDGYEIMVFTVEPSQWHVPTDWTVEETLVDIDKPAAEVDISLNTDAILDLSLGGMNCSSWYFVDNRAEGSFDQQDFYFAYCDDTYDNNIVIFIYRGHHLYGF